MFKLVLEKENFKRYDGYGYKIQQRFYDEEDYSITISKEFGEEYKYLPSIYSKTDGEEKIIDFEIETSSYGSLSSEEIERVISGYKIALDVVKELKEMFIDNR